MFIFYLLLFLILAGLVGVASNYSPNLGALSLVVAAGGGGGLLACLGKTFLSLILFLVYLGGMLVVFSYSVAFTASLGLKKKGNHFSVKLAGVYVLWLIWWLALFCWGKEKGLWFLGMKVYELDLFQEGVSGFDFLYTAGGGLLIMGALALLLILMAILAIVGEMCSGTVRAL